MIRALIMCLFAITMPQSSTSIDATDQPRELTRKTVAGSSGSNGWLLPIQLKTIIVNGGNQPGDSLYLDFIITNHGEQLISVPTSLHAADFQPTDSSPSAFKRLSLFVTAGDPSHPLMLKGGANLYGSPRFPGTLRTLNPSESLVVHTKFLLSFSNGNLSGVQSLIGHLSLLDETLKPKGADLESVSQDLAFATAEPVSWTIAGAK